MELTKYNEQIKMRFLMCTLGQFELVWSVEGKRRSFRKILQVHIIEFKSNLYYECIIMDPVVIHGLKIFKLPLPSLCQ
jgi:hypothetical protein